MGLAAWVFLQACLQGLYKHLLVQGHDSSKPIAKAIATTV